MGKFMILIVAFLLVGAYIISINRNYDLQNNAEDREGFIRDFSGWIVNVGKNLKDVTNVAREKEWLPDEEDFKEYDNETIK